MQKDFILPDIGEGIVECEVVEWLVEEGGAITEDQPVVELMTDKAVVQIPSADEGKIVKWYYQKGEIAKVHTPLYSVEVEGEAESTTASNETASSQKSSTPSIPKDEPSPDASKAGDFKKVLATPAVRRLGRELSIELSQVNGSGKDGRVLKEDVLKVHNQEHVPASTSETPTPPTPVQAPDLEDRVEPLRGIKLAMSKRMVESATTIPHFGYGDDIDLTALQNLRQRLKPQLADSGIKLTSMPFFVKALAMAVQKFPILNSSFNEDVTEIIYHGRCNVGIAVDSPMGLLVPNVKDAQNLSIIEIAQEIQRLVEVARRGRVDQKDLKGGTVTISNIGAIGGNMGIPIISKPEVAIVALGKIQNLPRFSESGAVEARQIMQATWSADHRMVDGGTMARFGNFWKQLLEDPAMMLIHLK